VAALHASARRRDPDWSGQSRTHCITDRQTGNLAYAAWRDGACTISMLPTRHPQLLSHPTVPPSAVARTRRAVARPQTCSSQPTEGNLALRPTHIRLHRCGLDVAHPTNPCRFGLSNPVGPDYFTKGAKFGARTILPNTSPARSSSNLIFATYQNAGVRVLTSRRVRPREVAHSSRRRPAPGSIRARTGARDPIERTSTRAPTG